MQCRIIECEKKNSPFIYVHLCLLFHILSVLITFKLPWQNIENNVSLYFETGTYLFIYCVTKITFPYPIILY